MLLKDKIAIVRFVPRATSQVRFCALYPQAESFDEDNFQTPPGFNLVFLPFSEDIRKLETVKPSQKVDIDRS
jgi:ATP-dependent DNA helicase 2 subunit 1